MSNIVYIATSIDGFIAGKNGELDWLPAPSAEDKSFEIFMESIDALVMGRNTYEMVLSFEGPWPYSKKVFVLTNSLKEIDQKLSGKVELISGELKDLIKTLNEKGYNNLYVDGGRTIQGFLKENLIDEITITTIPVILGDGIPLFRPMDLKISFEHCSTKMLDNGLITSHYKKV